MANLVIVAIPQEDDYVWQLSSEKVPHMTLLFLGDVEGKPVQKILEFLEHAVNILEFGPFNMEVDYRDTLGTDNADVLFFKKNWSQRRVANFRGQLLKSTPIRSAYDSVEQYDEWTPHLTMGYPETPAKKDTREFPGVRWVEFDRIALWYGDYEGPEFRLEYNYDYDFAEVAMSAAATRGAEFIEHHGVKGMKWGVRKSRPAPSAVAPSATSVVRKGKNVRTKIKAEGGQNHPATQDAIKAAVAKQKLKRSGTHSLTNAELQDLQTRLNLEQNVKRLVGHQTAGRKFVGKVTKDPYKTIDTVERSVKTARRFNKTRKAAGAAKVAGLAAL